MTRLQATKVRGSETTIWKRTEKASILAKSSKMIKIPLMLQTACTIWQMLARQTHPSRTSHRSNPLERASKWSQKMKPESHLIRSWDKRYHQMHANCNNNRKTSSSCWKYRTILSKSTTLKRIWRNSAQLSNPCCIWNNSTSRHRRWKRKPVAKDRLFIRKCFNTAPNQAWTWTNCTIFVKTWIHLE